MRRMQIPNRPRMSDAVERRASGVTHTHTLTSSLSVTRHCSSLAQMLFQSFENHTAQKPTETTACSLHFTGERLEL